MKVMVKNELSASARRRDHWCAAPFFASLFERAETVIPAQVLKRFGTGGRTLTVVLATGRTMRQLNKQFRGIDRMTDVLSFEADAAEYPYMGDLVLCLSVAARQARQFKRTVQKEMALLFVHGVLHLCGYDHMKARERKEMFALQDAILGERVRYDKVR